VKPVRFLRLLLFSALVAAHVVVGAAPEAHFQDKVWPLLDSRCISCHGPDKVKGGLRLDSREATLRGGDSGPALVPGKPADSLLLQAVLHARKDLEMPPKEKLTPQDIAVLERWISEGVPWPQVEKAPAQPAIAPGEHLGDAWSDPRNPIVRIFGGQRLDLWSLKRVAPVEPPPLRNPHSAIRNPIDRFIAAKLAGKHLSPSPEADRRTLIRRLAFDLTGLPPTLAEVEDFQRDDAPDAYERLVDRLLSSPRYGEHQARLWLDVIRYSDSNGFDWDEFRKEAWRFRDYAIRAFNADKPFDQFIREQLAGDELLDRAPATPAEQDLLIATGYLRLGPQDNSAPLFNEQSRARAEFMADLTETTGSAFLGLTFSCCRCHDHKYDPISQADHFRLRAFFEPVKHADDTPLDLAGEQAAIRRQHAEIDARLQPLDEQRDGILSTAKQRVRAERLARLSPEERRLVETSADPQSQTFTEKAAELARKLEPSDDDARKAFTEEEKQRHEALGKQVDGLRKQKRPFTHGLLATDQTGKIPATRIHFQGDHKAEREAVVPGFLSALDPNPATVSAPINPETTGRRLTLADWIASPANPLTARVLVNRVWLQHFGQGLVATPNDFGLAGARPTHPELLDWLAGEFMRGGWSLKQLHRLIVTSATYRQASAAAADTDDWKLKTENSLLWRQNPRRLSAEQLRDALLAVSGLLTGKSEGPPVWPDLPPETLQANPAFLDDNETKTKGWYPSPKEQQWARSVFLVQKRTVRVPFMETFDLPENSVSCARRNESTVAPQALSLLNSPLAIEATRAFAGRVQREAGGSMGAQVIRAFQLALQRRPVDEEFQLSLRLARERGLPELCRALLNLNEFIYMD